MDLKAELTGYLEKRRQLRADEEAKAEVGKVIGGTKGNPVLEYISGAPNKPIVIEDEPNIFDYDQLTKYGYDVSARCCGILLCRCGCHVNDACSTTLCRIPYSSI